MAIKKVILLSLLSMQVLADPLSEAMFQDRDANDFDLYSYFSRKPIIEKGSLPVVSSKIEGAQGRIQGSSFIIQIRDHSGPKGNYLLTNAHLLQGSDKMISDLPIPDDHSYFCSDDDVAIVDLAFLEADLPAFGVYDKEENSLYTHGKNNSPRGYVLTDSYSEGFYNKNKRPLFENQLTGERFNFVQMGNMFDLSCNYYPSSPEYYDGNAVFIPITEHIKDIAENPSPFTQRIFNQINTYQAHMARTIKNDCFINMDGEIQNNHLHKKSYFSGNMLFPAGIVPGMSGSPLLINEDLRQSRYEIAGMVTAYDRRVQVSHFIGQKSIKSCLDKAIAKKHEEGTVFKYDPVQNTLYRQDENFVEIPFITASAGSHFAGNGAAGNGGNGAAGNGGNGAAGNGGNGAAGNGGDCSLENAGNGAAGNGGNGAAGNGGDSCDSKSASPKAGLNYKGEHTLGFRCIVEGRAFNIYANWEARLLVNEGHDCSPITAKDADLKSLLLEKFKDGDLVDESAKASYLHSFDLKIKVEEVLEDKALIKVSGSYYVKEIDTDIYFKDTIEFDFNSEVFNPFVSIKIDKTKITNWFNDYEGGEEIILDLREFFFINLERVYAKDYGVLEALEENNLPKVHGALKSRKANKGSVPVELRWK